MRELFHPKRVNRVVQSLVLETLTLSCDEMAFSDGSIGSRHMED